MRKTISLVCAILVSAWVFAQVPNRANTNFYGTNKFYGPFSYVTSGISPGYVLTASNDSGAFEWAPSGGAAWSLTGNAGTNTATNYIGTNDSVPFQFFVNGQFAGELDLRDTYNSSFGLNSNNNGGTWNVAFGVDALTLNTGTANTSIGFNTLSVNTTGSTNVALGAYALNANINGNSNIGIGYTAMQNNVSGSSNIGIGQSSLESNTSGNSNIAIGFQSIQSNTTGYENIGIGDNVLANNDTGSYNVAIGFNALQSTSINEGFYNNAIGYKSLFNNSDGNQNVSIGTNSLYQNTTGNSNSAIGSASLYNNTTGSSNVAIGEFSLHGITVGTTNTAIGYYSGWSANRTGSDNTFVGDSATTGGRYSNASAIGANSIVNCSNCGVLGDNTQTNMWGVGTNTPSDYLDTSGLVVVGQFNYTDGTQGAGKVLTSDLSGNASWQAQTGNDTLVTPTTAGSFNCAAGQTGIIFSGGGTAITYTLNLPANPSDGLRFIVETDGSTLVTTLTTATTDGSTVSGFFSTGVGITATFQRFIVYHKASNTWY